MKKYIGAIWLFVHPLPLTVLTLVSTLILLLLLLQHSHAQGLMVGSNEVRPPLTDLVKQKNNNIYKIKIQAGGNPTEKARTYSTNSLNIARTSFSLSSGESHSFTQTQLVPYIKEMFGRQSSRGGSLYQKNGYQKVQSGYFFKLHRVQAKMALIEIAHSAAEVSKTNNMPPQVDHTNTVTKVRIPVGEWVAITEKDIPRNYLSTEQLKKNYNLYVFIQE